VARRRSDRGADLEALYAQLPTLECKGLCTDCCGPIDMSPLERTRLKEIGVRIPLPIVALETVKREGNYDCTALVDGLCSVYERRPSICRLWGVVESIPCPHGCKPDPGYLTDQQGWDFLQQIHSVS
jgi:hypothetical protein